jgi:hypothetical protein
VLSVTPRRARPDSVRSRRKPVPTEAGSASAKETIDPLAQVTDRSSRCIESGSISMPSTSTTDPRALPPSPGPRGIPQRSPARFHPRSSILLVWMAVPTITSGIRLLLRLCRRAGRRLNDARLGVSADAGQHASLAKEARCGEPPGSGRRRME